VSEHAQEGPEITHLRKVELQWVIRAQANIQADLEELLYWIPFIGQEQSIVAERAHRHPDLTKVEEIL
jgi:hypothetical protein